MSDEQERLIAATIRGAGATVAGACNCVELGIPLSLADAGRVPVARWMG